MVGGGGLITCSCSLALPHIRHAMLLYILLYFRTCHMHLGRKPTAKSSSLAGTLWTDNGAG